MKSQPFTPSLIARLLTFAALEADDLFKSSCFLLPSAHWPHLLPQSHIFPKPLQCPWSSPPYYPPQSSDLFYSRGDHLYFFTNLPLPRPLLFPAPKCSPTQDPQLLPAPRAKISFPKSSKPPIPHSPSLSSSFLTFSRFI